MVNGNPAIRDPGFLHTRALLSFARTRAPARVSEFFEIMDCQIAIHLKTPSP